MDDRPENLPREPGVDAEPDPVPGEAGVGAGPDPVPITPGEAAARYPEEGPDTQLERSERGMLIGAGALLALVVGAAAIWWRDQPVTTSHYLLLSMILFATGAVGVLLRRNAIVLFMCIELMLNAVNLAFIAFARMHGSMDGHAVVLFVMIVAAAEVTVGLAIIVSIFMRRHTANVDELAELRG